MKDVLAYHLHFPECPQLAESSPSGGPPPVSLAAPV